VSQFISILDALPGTSLDIRAALLSVLLAYILSQLFAWAYMFTHRGVSYSQSFVQSLVLLAIVVCIVMLAVGNNIIIAFGLFGALAIIRFRNILKDTRDTAFLFMMIAIGMAAGTYNYALASLGTGVFIAIVVLFHLGNFGSRHRYDGFLHFRLAGPEPDLRGVEDLVGRHALRSRIVSQRSEEAGTSYTMRLLLRNPKRAPELVDALREFGGVSGVSLILQEDESEI
jgi:uncharacterized membrane protein YhiD involved in acid resistance